MNVKQKLKKAKNILGELSGKEIQGFRAPRFSIGKNNLQHLRVIDELFKYDSSLHFSSIKQFEDWQNKSDFHMKEIPVSSQKLDYLKLNCKLGGSYYKLFPIDILLKAIEKTSKNGLMPVIYFHPYDLLIEPGFMLKFDEMKGLSSYKRFYWFLRQMQWTWIFNNRIETKLQRIGNVVEHIGPLNKVFL